MVMCIFRDVFRENSSLDECYYEREKPILFVILYVIHAVLWCDDLETKSRLTLLLHSNLFSSQSC